MVQIKKLLLGSLLSSAAFGAGYEQLLTWSGKNVGNAGAVTSSIEGAEAIYFNPAGLVFGSADDPKNDISANLGYIHSRFDAPVTTPNQSQYSKFGNNYTAAVLYSRQLSDKFAIGAGLLPSAGLEIEYANVANIGGVPAAPKVNLRVYEFTAGAAYKPAPRWSVGLAYRVAYSTADFAALSPIPQAPGNYGFANFSNMQGWDFFSFRAGAQYKGDDWGVGLNVRTPVSMKVKGKLTFSNPFTPTATDSSATLSTTLPLAISLGGHYNVTDKLTLALDYTFLNYQAVDKLRISQSASAGITDVPLNWKNSHVFRLGGDYALGKINLRAGYVLMTAVSNKDTMLPTSEPPGIGNLFTLGGGYSFTKSLQANASLFYGFGSGDGNTTATGNLGGEYSVMGIAALAGVDWKF